MRAVDWKVLFQERSLLTALLTSPVGRLSRAEALGYVNLEGARLDALVRGGVLFWNGEEICLGAGLLLLRGQDESQHSAFLWGQWLSHWAQANTLAAAMEAAEDLHQRTTQGALIHRCLAELRSWTHLLELSLNKSLLLSTAGQPDPSTISSQFSRAAKVLQAWVIRSAAYPAWEQEQIALQEDLEAAAHRLEGLDLHAEADPRLRKVETLLRMTPNDLVAQTNIGDILAEGHFLALHNQLTVVVHPDLLPGGQAVQASSPMASGSSSSLSVHPDQIADLVMAWQASGTDLYSFLLTYSPTASFPQAQRMDLFGKILKRASGAIWWKKSVDGNIWEVWPSSDQSSHSPIT